MDSITFLPVHSWDNTAILRLYQDAGWWQDTYSPDEIPRLIASSFLFVVGVSVPSQKTVAMGRILSDGTVGIIQDMCVLLSFRGQGIGIRLLQYLIQSGQDAGLLKLMLVAEPSTEAFYMKSGFISDKSKIFFLQTV